MKPGIEKLCPCREGAEYYASKPSFREAWENCHRGDWMLWLAKKVNVDDRLLTLAKGLCANTVRHLMKDERSIEAVDAAIAYGKGEICKRRLDVAAAAAYDALTPIAYDAPLAPATYAAAASLVASFAAYYAAAAAAYIPAAAYNPAAAYAIAVAAAADTYTPAVARDVDIAEKDIQLKTAEICRGILTDEIMEKMRLI